MAPYNFSHLKLLFSIKVLLLVNLHSILSLTCDVNTVTLQDGDSPLEGRVEVCVNGQRGSVCAYDWDNLDASVVCRQLGFSCSGASATQLVIEPSMQDIVLFESKCIGNETILTDCPHSLQSLPCITDSVAGVICLEASCNNGDARLVNGSSPLEGRVEVCVNQGNFTQWGSVCTPLNIITAAVVCRQLHLADNNSVFDSRVSCFGPGTLPILLYNPRCSLSSQNLLDKCTIKQTFGCNAVGVICPGTTYVDIVDVKPGITSIRLLWTLLMIKVSHYEVLCSTNKGQSLTYKTSVTVYGNTHNMIELEGLQPSSNYNCCVTAYHNTQLDNGNQNTEVHNQSCVSVETLSSRYISPSQCQVTSAVSVTMFMNTTLSPSDNYGCNSTMSKSTIVPTNIVSPQMVCENFIITVAGAAGGGVVCVILFLLILSCVCLVCVRISKKSNPERPQIRFGENTENNNAEFSLYPRTHTPTSNQTETTFDHLDPPTEPVYAPLTDFPPRTSTNGNITNHGDDHGDDHTPDFEHAYDMPSCLSRVEFAYSGSQHLNGDICRANRTGSLEARNRRFDVGSFDDVDSEEPKNIYHILEEGPSASSNGASANRPIQPPPVQRDCKPPTQHSSYESTENLFHFIVEPSHHSASGRMEPTTQLEGNQSKAENTETFYHVLEQNMTSEVDQSIPASRGEQTEVETNGVIPKKPKLTHAGGTETEPLYHVLEQRENNNSSRTSAVDTVANPQYIVLEGPDSDNV